MNSSTHEAIKINAIQEEVDASFDFIISGLKKLKAQNSVVSNNHVVLQAFAAGFERVLKMLLCIKDKHLTGSFPELRRTRDRFGNYSNGHGIKAMLDELIVYARTVDLYEKNSWLREQLEFIEFDNAFRRFISIITEFAIKQRYYYIDMLVSDQPIEGENPFSEFKSLICSFAAEVDVRLMSYEEEDTYCIKQTVICIEKGTQVITHFFTHYLGETGRRYYGDFSNFISLDEKRYGLLSYTEKRKYPPNSYQPMRRNSLAYLKIRIRAKSHKLCKSNFADWAFTVNEVMVLSMEERYFFVKICNEIFALTGATSTYYKIPNYFKSKKMIPRTSATYLLDQAKLL